MPLLWHSCIVCGADYMAGAHIRSRWCSHECRSVSMRGDNRHCVVCGCTYQVRSDRTDTCTWRCFEANLAQREAAA